MNSQLASPKKRRIEWDGYGLALLSTAVCSAIALVLVPYFDVLNLVMVYLLGIVLVSSRYGSGPSIMASVLAVLAFDFFLVPPHFTLAVSDLQYLVTFGVMLFVAVTISSLTVRNREQAQAAHERDMQIEAERLRSTLLSSVSHDLRTPLAAITGASSSLLEGGDSIDVESRRELAQTIYDEAERLHRLIRNLLDMTRIQSGAIKIKKEMNSLEEVIGATLARLDQRLAGRVVSTHLPPDLMVAYDSILLEQVFMNLLENAIKYTPPTSPIDIVAQALDDHVLVQVMDRGPGIPPGELEHVFEKFYRAQSSGNSGVGLGLTVCRGMLQVHGGRIWAENRPGGGAVFCFTLPIDSTQEVQSHA